MHQPDDFAAMGHEIRWEFGRNDKVHRHAIDFVEVDHPPCQDTVEQMLMGLPPIRQADDIDDVAAAPQCITQTFDEQLGAATDKWYLGCADDDAHSGYVPNTAATTRVATSGQRQ